MNEQDLKYIIEATLLAAGKPVTTTQLLEMFEERERPTQEIFLAAIELLKADYEVRGIEVIEVASGWRIQVRPRFADIVQRLWQERPSRYSRALLETLALVAYRQPITRSEIEEIRGVSISSTIMRTLQERNWIRTVGHREVPGRPELLGTTRDFLDYFGLKSLDQLPTLAELKDVETIGVQLELPADQPQPTDQTAAAEGEATATAEAGAEGEVAATDETAPTTEETVASAEDVSAEAETEESDDSSTDEDSSDDDSSNDNGESNDDSELSADAEDNDEDSDTNSTLVASDEEGDEDRGRIGEPPSDN